jgi:hypothetical protein
MIGGFKWLLNKSNKLKSAGFKSLFNKAVFHGPKIDLAAYGYKRGQETAFSHLLS